MAEQSDFKFAIGRAHNALGKLCYHEGEGEQALGYYQKAAQLAAEAGYVTLHKKAEGRLAALATLPFRQDS
jgi:hypothetical protein